jgi:hypothetical protein
VLLCSADGDAPPLACHEVRPATLSAEPADGQRRGVAAREREREKGLADSLDKLAAGLALGDRGGGAGGDGDSVLFGWVQSRDPRPASWRRRDVARARRCRNPRAGPYGSDDCRGAVGPLGEDGEGESSAPRASTCFLTSFPWSKRGGASTTFSLFPFFSFSRSMTRFIRYGRPPRQNRRTIKCTRRMTKVFPWLRSFITSVTVRYIRRFLLTRAASSRRRLRTICTSA